MEINSLENPKIKKIIKLRKAKERNKQNFIIIEGHRELLLALKAGIKVKTIFYCASFNANKEKSLPTEIKNNLILDTSPAVFKKISYRENPDGFLVLAEPKEIKLPQIKLSPNPLLIILESVEKPGNLGAILRTADAAGIDGIIINNPKTDIYNPNVIRASQGTVFTSQIALASIKETKAWLKDNNIISLAATPRAQNAYTVADLSRPLAIVMGAEDKGLSQEWLLPAQDKIRIPMKGKIDSLNVSASAAIIIFESLRQRAGLTKIK
ncbi:rRNA methyltransferase [Candidatus Shapirobacteria bacterium CG_4_10_14_3_um_filter_35_13]|uniref:rRNA methyltransferase n=1 Tax=Candidatus Shapirobacteria bacterium CG_4_10_14_3_um_filter_35_13 TaxID=1974873 RepID=A0A2M7LIM8_9BACT|nr:MAG: rRNA methyltransferase [Candidatus Shapirobacteria bacterium CG_4_10_14_3_um_filter_35_13]